MPGLFACLCATLEHAVEVALYMLLLLALRMNLLLCLLLSVVHQLHAGVAGLGFHIVDLHVEPLL